VVNFQLDKHAFWQSHCVGPLTYQALFLFISGSYEPGEAECEWPSDSEDEETELSDEVKEKVLHITVKATIVLFYFTIHPLKSILI
jgi:hypothetical protein